MVKTRPAWHIDAKWVCSLLLLGLLAVTLPLVAAFQLTQRGPATSLIAYTMVGLTSPDGIDNPNGLDDLRAQIAAAGNKTLVIAGIPVNLTAADLNALSPRQLRLKVFGAFADKFYDLGAAGLAKSTGATATDTQRFENDATALAPFTAAGHQQLGRLMAIAVLLCLVLTAGVAYFSFHLGRLVSLGLVLVLAGLPGLIFGALAANIGDVPHGTARTTTSDSPLAAATGFLAYVAPLCMKALAGTYLTVLVAGVILLVVAVGGKIIWHGRKSV